MGEDQESFEEHDEHSDEQEQHTMEFQLPSMDDVFSRLEQALPAMEQRIAPAMNRVMEIEIANPFEDYEDVEMIEESPRMSMPWGMPRGIFGQSSRQEVNQGFGFSSLLNHLTNNIMSSQASESWSPFGESQHDGKLTIIKAGPVFHKDEPKMDPDAEIFEVTKSAKTQSMESTSEPVMDVWAEEEETKKDEPIETAKAPEVESFEFSAKHLPYLAVLRNSVEESERMSEELLNRYRAMAEREYRDDYSCNSDHLKWSDWVACLHARVGVPRWLTAATISLGIVFSVWLCLVIPSSAPKQRIRALVIKTEKPSSALAKAKEAEACSKACEAAGVDPCSVVSVVRVDLPPSYGEVRPASPAPSYKSEMGVPASPAPSYRSVAPDTKETQAGGAVVPVHGEKENKESAA